MKTYSITELEHKISSGEADGFFRRLYGDAEQPRIRYRALLSAFRERFGERQAFFVSAPGRTELSGNHTDHQHGCVLCAALTVDTLCLLSPRQDEGVCVLSEGYGETTLCLSSLAMLASEQGSTAALIRGMAAEMAAHGIPVTGFDACVCSDVPAGGGFSSSASFEILMGAVFCALAGRTLPPLELAKSAQRTENRYFGKPCGLMDQSACALGGVSMLDFADPAAPVAETVPFDFKAHGLVLAAVSVGSSHADLTADYAAIPGEMALVAHAFGKEVLRQVDEADFLKRRAELSQTLPRRALLRAEHYYAEEARVPLMEAALRRGDTERYRALMLESGESSRTLLQNIIPDSRPTETRLADALERCRALLGDRGAWRVHGGGFGGSLLALLPRPLWDEFRTAMDAVYGPGATQELTIRNQGAAVWPEQE